MDIANLTGIELDTMVAKLSGVEPGAAYSTDWSHAGPIIEREQILLSPTDGTVWRAVHIPSGDVGPLEPGLELVDGEWNEAMIPTPLAMESDKLLVAAMRVYVAAKLHDRAAPIPSH